MAEAAATGEPVLAGEDVLVAATEVLLRGTVRSAAGDVLEGRGNVLVCDEPHESCGSLTLGFSVSVFARRTVSVIGGFIGSGETSVALAARAATCTKGYGAARSNGPGEGRTLVRRSISATGFIGAARANVPGVGVRAKPSACPPRAKPATCVGRNGRGSGNRRGPISVSARPAEASPIDDGTTLGSKLVI